MAKYTALLGDIVQSGFDLGLDKYPIFDESHRIIINDKIIEHYFEYEIGKETAESFKFALNRAMNEIMPLYNKFYKSELIAINPLLSFEKTTSSSTQKDSETIKDQDSTIIKDQDSTITKEQNTVNSQIINNTSSLDNTTSSNTNDVQNVENNLTQDNSVNTTTDKDTTTTNDSTNIKSDTPQTELLAGDIQNNLYASEGTVIKDSNVVDDLTNINETNNLTKDETIKTSTDSLTTNTTDTDSKSDTVSNTNNNIDDTTNSTLDDTTTSSLDDNTKINETETFDNLESGIDRSQSELIMQYRESLIDVDMLVVHDVKIRELFMMIY